MGLLLACSKMVMRSAVNGEIVGSIPTGPEREIMATLNQLREWAMKELARLQLVDDDYKEHSDNYILALENALEDAFKAGERHKEFMLFDFEAWKEGFFGCQI